MKKIISESLNHSLILPPFLSFFIPSTAAPVHYRRPLSTTNLQLSSAALPLPPQMLQPSTATTVSASSFSSLYTTTALLMPLPSPSPSSSSFHSLPHSIRRSPLLLPFCSSFFLLWCSKHHRRHYAIADFVPNCHQCNLPSTPTTFLISALFTTAYSLGFLLCSVYSSSSPLFRMHYTHHHRAHCFYTWNSTSNRHRTTALELPNNTSWI